MSQVRILTICVSCFLCLFGFSVESSADENKDVPVDFCLEDNWIDSAYCRFHYSIDNSANSLNDMFKVHPDVDDPATTRGRLRFGWEPRTGNLAEFDFRFRIRLKLPAFENRVELLLSDDEDDINRQDVKAARRDEFNNSNKPVLALQFKTKEDDKISYRLGFGRGSQLYTRTRYTDVYKIDEKIHLFYFAEANYYSEDKLGFEFNGVLGIELNETSGVEFNNSFRFRDPSDDWYWRHEFQYLLLKDDSASYLYTASIEGVTRPNYRKEQMFMSVRYKQKFLREWLFIELEPYVLWLRKEDFRASLGMAVRFEVHFET
ncbi:hypothetical protein [Glaciecola sp. 1036]|uniref:hypothetical protein n=1 Tax=Alteromonadaceae TaxID=72275 RepID=UPI003D014F22